MELKTKKIIFMGTPRFASEILENLLKNHVPIDSIFTQPDRPSGRKGKLTKPEVKLTAEKYELEIFQFPKLNEDAITLLKNKKPDFIIVAAYGIILPKEILQIPKFGCINVHASILPQLRGSSPIHKALRNGLLKTGVSIMKMDEGIDTGDVFCTKDIEIKPFDKYFELETRLIELSNSFLIEILEKIIKNDLKAIPQENVTASSTKMIKKQDGVIDWSKQDAKEVFNLFRAFHIWPKAQTFLTENGQRKKLVLTFKKYIDAEKSQTPGQVFSLDEDILVSTISGSLVIDTIQLEGKKELPAKDFLNGRPSFISAVLK